jgi:chromosome segregation ATPase
MNIQEAEELLNATKLHLEWRQSDLQELHTKQAELDTKKQELQEQIKEYKETIEHWTNVVSIMRIKANIKLASSKVSLATR